MLLGVDVDETKRTISIERQSHGPDNCKSEKIGIKFRRDNPCKISNPETGIISPIETNRAILFWLRGQVDLPAGNDSQNKMYIYVYMYVYMYIVFLILYQ